VCAFGDPLCAAAFDGLRVPEITARLTARLESAMDALAARAAARQAAPFDTLLHGRVGVGRLYDGWRFVRATLAGERFRAGHREAEP
jgi:hypothetical protein